MSGFNPAYAAFKLSFVDSPIFLSGGLAQGIGTLPLLVITESLNLVNGLLAGGSNVGLDNFFGSFTIPAGGTLIDFQYAHYPFANQAVAANAAIAQPLQISLIMNCPAQLAGGYLTKSAIMNMMANMLYNHVAQGGTFIVLTPSYIYVNCLLLKVTDVSPVGEDKQAQVAFQFDFEQPLLTIQQAQQVMNGFMNKLNNGTQITMENAGWSGQTTIGSTSPVSNLLVPTGSGTEGSVVTGAPFTQAPVQTSPLPALSSPTPPLELGG
jgi:hypothetical protein